MKNGLMLPMRRSLLASLSNSLPPQPRKPPKVDKRRVSDPARIELIAQVRGDSELRGMSHAQIAEKRGITLASVRYICGYLSALHTDPK